MKWKDDYSYGVMRQIAFTISWTKITAWEICGHIETAKVQITNYLVQPQVPPSLKFKRIVPPLLQESSADFIREQQVAIRNKRCSDLFFPSKFTDWKVNDYHYWHLAHSAYVKMENKHERFALKKVRF